jgi:hypothetical protein
MAFNQIQFQHGKLFPLNYLPYLFEKNAVVVEFI